MNMPVKIVFDILKQSEQFKGYPIFMLDVPDEFQTVAKLPLIRINEVDSYQSSFNSNMPSSQGISVQIDIWCANMQQANDFYYALDKLMATKQWMNNLGGTDKDPDFNNTIRLYKRYSTTQRLNFSQ